MLFFKDFFKEEYIFEHIKPKKNRIILQKGIGSFYPRFVKNFNKKIQGRSFI